MVESCRRSHWILPLLAVLAGSALAAAQQEPFTLEQVMSAPFPSELVAAPAGGKVAWVFDASGGRNIWVAEPPDYKGASADFLRLGRRAGNRRTRVDARCPRHRLCARG